VHSILQDVRWLVTGDLDEQRPPPWHGAVRHASDYFPVIYQAARYLIEKGLAYVDDLTAGMTHCYDENHHAIMFPITDA